MINGGMFDFEPEGDLKVTGHGAGGVRSSVCNLGPGVVTGCVLTDRSGAVEGKSGGLGGSRIMKKERVR